MSPVLARMLTRLGPGLGLLLVVAIFGSLVPESFLTLGNFRTIAAQTVIPALCALGMTFVIGSGGIDLSAGSQVALAAVVCAYGMRAGFGETISCGLAMLATTACGFVNGALITTLRVVPFIVTLGMLGIARGLAKWISGEQKIDAPAGWLSSFMAKSPEPAWLLVAPGVWMLGLLALVLGLVLRRTTFGLHAIAIGSSEATARLCGVPVDRRKIQLYMLLGALCGLAGCMSFGRLTVGDPTTAVGLELHVIAAVVIGGGSLSGGECSIFGAVVGALVMYSLQSGCNQAGVPTYVQEIVIGAIIIAAVAIDRFRGKLIG